MNVIAKPGVDKIDFELYSLAISAANGCSMCLEAHAREVGKAGASREAVQDVPRIAAVVHSTAAVLTGEEAFTESRQLAA